MRSSRTQVSLWFLVLFNVAFLAALAALPRALTSVALGACALGNAALGGWMIAARRGTDAQGSHQQEVDWPVALLTLDASGKISRCNAEARALLGLGESEHSTLSALTHPEEEPQNVRLLSSMSGATARDHVQDRRCFAHGCVVQMLWHLRFHAARTGAQQSATVFVEDVSQLRAAQEALACSHRSLSDLHQIVSGRQLEEQIGALLELGRRRFGVETAFVSQEREGKLRLLEVRSQDPRLRRLSSYTLAETRTSGPLRRPLGPRGLAHAPFIDDLQQPNLEPVFVSEGETYLGAPILAEGTLWGGLHFSDAEPRARIEDEDKQFLGTMAAWLGGEIERRQVKARLEEQQKELLEAAVQLENLAVRDGLTGAKNRRALDEHLQTEWLRARRYKTPLSLILLDVDKFKSFNDTFGHPAGDEVLKKVAQVLGDSIRNIDFLARYGGEEFVLLLPNTDAPGAMIVAERLRLHIEEANWMLRPVTASFGVATIEAEMKAPSELLQAADAALYRSKESGRNRVSMAASRSQSAAC